MERETEKRPVTYLTFLVTNNTPSGEYTPSTFSNIDEAVDWMRELTIINYINGHNPEFEGKELTDGEIGYSWLKHHNLIEKFIENYLPNQASGGRENYINRWSSLVTYADESFNEMRIYVIGLDNDTGKYFVELVNRENIQQSQKPIKKQNVTIGDYARMIPNAVETWNTFNKIARAMKTADDEQLKTTVEDIINDTLQKYNF